MFVLCITGFEPGICIVMFVYNRENRVFLDYIYFPNMKSGFCICKPVRQTGTASSSGGKITFAMLHKAE